MTDNLRRLAEAAQQGHWIYVGVGELTGEHEVRNVGADGGSIYVASTGLTSHSHGAANARYIAAANPLRNLKMLDALDKAQMVVERWDSPKWKDEVHTAVFVNALRSSLAALDGSES